MAASESTIPMGFDVALVTSNVVDAHAKALSVGAKELKAP